MQRRKLQFLVGVATLVTWTTAAWAAKPEAEADGPSPKRTAPAAASSPQPASSAPAPGAAAVGGSTATELPPGHPPIGAEQDEADTGVAEDLPPGHPPTRGGAKGAGGRALALESTSVPDPSLPAGVIAVRVVQIRDKERKAVPRATVTLGSIEQTIARSESRRRLSGETDDSGVVRFGGLPTGSTTSYRASIEWPGENGVIANYAAPPFQLELGRGQSVTLVTYPATNRVDGALFGIQAGMYVGLKEDVLEFETLFQIFNVGEVTWVPDDVLFDLPRGAKAFVTEQGMSDAKLQAVGNQVRLSGTFAPGEQTLQMKFQVPYDGGETVETVMGLPPRVVTLRVAAEAAKGMRLVLGDAPAAVPSENAKGGRVLITERQIRPGERPIRQARITLENVPGPGRAPLYALALAVGVLGVGAYAARSKDSGGGTKASGEAAEARERLVAELALLEKARTAGDIGPKTYARARNELLDALARLIPGRA